MGKGTRALIAVLAGLLAAILLMMAVFVTAALLAYMQMNALVSQIAANPNTYLSSTPVVVTSSSSGYIATANLLRATPDDVTLLRLAIFIALSILGGAIVALAAYRLLGRGRVTG